ncbi:MAG TPA: efflux transporter outer membrane subunit [Bryobacteraceae bacterium]|jgi:multidrug efflux system outer membrane protein|nr:efflux transporter outer membrane subunit [Bryobacteraceae bacterium]
MQKSSAAVSLIAILSTGCTMGPNYHRPPIQTPDSFRAPTPVLNDPASLADLKWWDVFKDEQLQELERTALVQNYDLRDAVAHVDAARANLGITRSNQYPNFEADGSLSTVRLSRNGETPLPASFVPSQNRTFGSATLSLLSFELDIWGRLRRATEAARANLLASEETRKAVVTTLVSDVASAYLSLRTLDYQLDISERTLATRRASLELIKQRRVGGVATRLDVRQGEQLVYTATETIPTLQQQIEQTENQINLLLGKNPGEVKRGRSLTEQQLPDVPPGLPSALLERRPDIRAAEQNLVAANAQIGIAKAAYFPQISLTGFLGGQGNQLSSLFSGPSRVWSLAPQVAQPIFTAGRLKSNVKLTEALQQSALIQYEKAIQTAFSEVSDALIAHQRVRESRIQQELLVAALQDRTQLAYVRYRGGVDTLLNALDADRDLFQAELDLSQIRLNELLSVVQLYKSLGGGWQ